MKKKSVRQFERLCRKEAQRTPYLPDMIAPAAAPRRWMPILSTAGAACAVFALTITVILFGTPIGQGWLTPAGGGQHPSVFQSFTPAQAETTTTSTWVPGDTTGTATTTGVLKATTTTVNTTTTVTTASSPSTPTSQATQSLAPVQNPQSLEGYKQALDAALTREDFRMQNVLTRDWILLIGNEAFTGLTDAETSELKAYMLSKGLDVRAMTPEERREQGLVTDETHTFNDGSTMNYQVFHGCASLGFAIEKEGDGYQLHLEVYYGPLAAKGIRTEYERAGGGWRLTAPENAFMA